ncbi:MAG: cysteine--tRNA ligase [Phycisphaerales bacterium JB052]
MSFHLYNTLNNRLEPFVPRDPREIRFYTCGPTVYDDAHIGNFRSFLAADLLRRWLESPLCTLESDPIQHENFTKDNDSRRVIHVMNITDVGHMTDDDSADGGGEDKMEVAARRIAEAKKSGKLPPDAGVDPDDPFAIARFYERRFKDDAIALGMKVAIEAEHDPSLMPRATDNIQQMKEVIEDLLAHDYAYPAGTPGRRAIYFDVQKFKAYGQLSGNTIDQLKGGAGGRVDDTNTQEKHHPADFLLWKEDATHKMKWPSPKVPNQEPWGDGYPGWHIECTAMALRRLVPGGLKAAQAKHAVIDLHSGGEDNIFPHHECEIAQSCCFTGADHFANYWFHPRFLKVDGRKMSKSKGTMYTLADLEAKGFEPAVVRLELIKTHYRANADLSQEALRITKLRLERWREMARRLHYALEKDIHAFDYQGLMSAVEKFTLAMSNDLNIADAIASIDTAAKSWQGLGNPDGSFIDLDMVRDVTSLPQQPLEQDQINEMLNSNQRPIRQLALLHQIDRVLGVIFVPRKSEDTGIALYQPGVTPSEEIESLLQKRADAKKSKDFATADAIRDQLAAMGLSIMDKPGGKVEVAIAN